MERILNFIVAETALLLLSVSLVLMSMRGLQCVERMEDSPITNLIMLLKVCGGALAREEIPTWVLSWASSSLTVLAAGIQFATALRVRRWWRRRRAAAALINEIQADQIERIMASKAVTTQTVLTRAGRRKKGSPLV